MSPLTRFLAAALLFLPVAASARVISYAPYSDEISVPALQHRMNRHMAIVEAPTAAYYGGIILAPIYAPGYNFGQLVVYDTKGLDEPRVVFPQDGTLAGISIAAVYESANDLLILPSRMVPTILIQTNSELHGLNPQHLWLYMLSTDGGATWTHLLLPSSTVIAQSQNFDFGGSWARWRGSPIRTGNDTNPFIVAVPGTGIYAIGADASTKVLLSAPQQNGTLQLVGTDHFGTRFLVRNAQNTIVMVDLTGQQTPVATVDPAGSYEGWIAPDGAVFLEMSRGEGRFLTLYESGKSTFILGPYNLQPPVIGAPQTSGDTMAFYAEPTIDFNGAWMIQRGAGKQTTLSRYTRGSGVQQQWQDITGPEVEAIIPGVGGNSVLIQVHRQRPQADQRLFKDPALAVWHVGEPAPNFYDELYLNETPTKGFVHIDVDHVASGDPFVFDSGAQYPQSAGVIISPSVPGGGSDVTQEWGVIRASLTQRLVLPGIARTAGAFGSFWQTDLILHNPSNATQNVAVHYVPTGDTPPQGQAVSDRTVTLDPNEIRVIPDVLQSLFLFQTGGGAFFLTPDVGIDATSRTYTTSAAGTFGFGMNAIDVYAAASPRFPVSFAAALEGPNFRTNVVLTDVSGRGSDNSLVASGTSGPMGYSNVLLHAPTYGQQQYNFLNNLLGVLPSDTGALVVQPMTGETIASVFAIDNRTNDPTYFPPDLPAPFVRTIPAIGHVDGANNSKFRSDLFLFNPAGSTRQVTLQIKMWDTNDAPQTLTLTMLPNEARVIRDVLSSAFGRSGIARLRYQSSSTDAVGVRVTSRTYTIDDNGGTYGFLMPPLNNFQAASSGDTLEIFGAVGDKRFRTNVGLVELASGFVASQPSVAVKIEIVNEKGVTVDSFSVNVPSAGGMQLNDIFHARGLGDGPAASIIRISPAGGQIGAYATIIDNGTNDPTYLAAQLAGK
jgi:hypothetical protein